MGIYYQSRASTTPECAGLWLVQIRVYVAGQVILINIYVITMR